VKIETTFDRARRYYTQEVSIIDNPLSSKAITRVEHQHLLSMYDPMDLYRLIWEILWDTGLRPFEVCKLQIENFSDDFKKFGYKIAKPKKVTRNGVIYVINNARIINIHSELADRLRFYVKTSQLPYGFLFPSFVKNRFFLNPRTLNWELNRHRKTLGGRWLEKNSYDNHFLSPKSYRCSWITRYAEIATDSFELAAAIGHKDPKTSYTYYQFTKHQKVKEFVEREAVKV